MKLIGYFGLHNMYSKIYCFRFTKVPTSTQDQAWIFEVFNIKIESLKKLQRQNSTALELRNIFQSLSAWEQWSNFLPCSKPQKTERKVKLTLLRRAFVKKLFVQKGKKGLFLLQSWEISKTSKYNTHSHGQKFWALVNYLKS